MLSGYIEGLTHVSEVCRRVKPFTFSTFIALLMNCRTIRRYIYNENPLIIQITSTLIVQVSSFVNYYAAYTFI